MIISDETVLLFLIIGVAIGGIYTLRNGIATLFSVKKIGVFFLDFTFAAISLVLSFIGSLAVTGGQLRVVPAILMLIGALCLYYAVGNPLQKLCEKLYLHRTMQGQHLTLRGKKRKVLPTKRPKSS